MNPKENPRTEPGAARAARPVTPPQRRGRLLRAGTLTVSAATVAAVLALGGCGGETMPAPPGLTAAPYAKVAYNTTAPFSAGVLPAYAPPVYLGDVLGLRLSSQVSGYGHLYLLNAGGRVMVLAENLPLTAGAQTAFPSPHGSIVLRATPPAGVERVVFLVTRQPFAGFGQGAAAFGPVQLPMTASTFVGRFNEATRQLPKQEWTVVETRIEIVGPRT